MLTKTKIFFIAFIIILSGQTNILSMMPYQAPKEIPKVNMLSIFQQFFVAKDEIAIKKELENNLKALQEKDQNNKLVTDEDSLLIKNLWDQLKLLYNYNWLDRITNPFRSIINEDDLIKIRNKRPFSLLLHSDKYSQQNQKQMGELFAYLGDTSRPSKPIDAVMPIVFEFAIDHSIVMSICLVNKAFPNFFRDRNFEEKLSSFDKRIASENKDIILYKSAIERKKQVIHHKLQQCKNQIDMHFMKNKPFKK